MKRTVKFILPLLLAGLVAFPAAAQTSYTLVAGMGHMSNFAYGNITNFPASAEIEQGVEDLGWFDDVDTSILMDINFGLSQRRLVQDPLTGEYLGAQELEAGSQYYYSSFYSQISYAFRNEMFYNRRIEGMALSLEAALNVRFEQAFDSFDNIRNGRSFLDDYLLEHNLNNGTTYWNAQTRFQAAPDIAGEAYMLANSLSLSAKWDNMYREDNKIYREGLDASATVTLAPWFLANRLPSFFDTSVDFYSLQMDATYAKVLYSDEDWRRWNKLAIVIEDRLYTQILLGSQVPKFADVIEFPGIGYTNLPVIVQNQLKLYVYGPNFLSDNTIPYGYVFLDLGLASGVPNNSINAGWKNFGYAEIGLNVHFELLGMMHLSAEVSYVFSNMETYGNFFDWNVGAYFSF